MQDPAPQIATAWAWLPLRTMTLPPASTTNALLIGHDQFIVLDPGAVSREEQAKLHREIDGRLKRGDRIFGIFLTHHHPDHVAGVEALLSHLLTHGIHDAPVMAHPETFSKLSLPPEAETRDILDGQRITLGGLSLEALHTPGHAQGHLALWDPQHGVLAAGDMVASEGTIIVAPPEGDMALYLQSLEKLKRLEGLNWLIPAHGSPVQAAHALLEHYIEHRLKRESLVLQALSKTPRTALELVPAAYPELAQSLYPLAAQSLLAHLIKLESENRAISDSSHRWYAA